MSIKSELILKSLKKDVPKLKIIEPYHPDVIQCENKEDFSTIINSDIEKYNGMTTHKLNKLFNVPGYRITKIKGEISLRKINSDKNTQEDNHIQEQIDKIYDAFNALSEQFQAIKQLVLGEHFNEE